MCEAGAKCIGLAIGLILVTLLFLIGSCVLTLKSTKAVKANYKAKNLSTILPIIILAVISTTLFLWLLIISLRFVLGWINIL